MPTDISHLPPSPAWVIPAPSGLDARHDPRGAVADWLAHIAAGRLSHNPAPPPAVLARRLATAAQFAAYAKERRA